MSVQQLKMYFIPGTPIADPPLPAGCSISAFDPARDVAAWCDCLRNGRLLADKSDRARPMIKRSSARNHILAGFPGSARDAPENLCAGRKRMKPEKEPVRRFIVFRQEQPAARDFRFSQPVCQ